MKQIETLSLIKALFLFLKYRKKYEDCVIISCFKEYRGRVRVFYYVECSNSCPTISASCVNLTAIPEGGAIYGDLS